MPKEFRFDGAEVRVSRAGETVLEKQPFDDAAWRAKLYVYLDTRFPECVDDVPTQPDGAISFD